MQELSIPAKPTAQPGDSSVEKMAVTLATMQENLARLQSELEQLRKLEK